MASAATWNAYDWIQCEGIPSPADGEVVGPGAEVILSVATPKDLDERIAETTTHPEDTFNEKDAFTWKAVDDKGQPAGEFPKGNLGQQVTWLAPDAPCTATISVVICDDAVIPAGDSGSREDSPGKFEVVVSVGGGQIIDQWPDIWDPDPPIQCLGPMIPANGDVYRCNKHVACTVGAGPTDWDTRDDPVNPDPPGAWDTFDEPTAYDWDVSAGSFKDGVDNEHDVTWITPSIPTDPVTIEVVIDDDAPEPPNNETGSRDDDPLGPPEWRRTCAVWDVNLSAQDLYGTLPEDNPGNEGQNEEDKGAYVHFNVDNDNGNTDAGQPVGDYTETDTVTGEDDLKPVAASVLAPNSPTEGTITLSIGANGRVWQSATKGNDNKVLVDELSKTWDMSVQAERDEFNAIKENLWVEGIAEGTAWLTLTYTKGDTTLQDRVKYTFIAALCGYQPIPYWRDWAENAFPSIVHCEWSQTAPSSPDYNCIAWTVGVTNLWYDPVDSDPYRGIVGIDHEYGDDDGVFEIDDDLDPFYGSYGYEPTGTGPEDASIMYYSNFHAAKRMGCDCGAGKWMMYESKCGPQIRLEHVHDQLNGQAYGQPQRYYKPRS